jgi:acyl carrier protein
MSGQEDSSEREALGRLVLETLGRVAPDLDPAALDPDAAFRDQFEIDSVDFLNFVLALEQALGRRIPEGDWPRLSSLNGCLAYLSRG